jgi:hypothetical protein
MIQVGSLLLIEDEIYIVYSVRNDGKIYFRSLDLKEEFTTTMEEIIAEKWRIYREQ